MNKRPEFEFVKTAACRDARVNNCPAVAVNVPGVVALCNTEDPDTIVVMTAAEWADLSAAVRGGEYDLSV
ncbi:DUF397 domain-containing protein [Streptomyces sp. NPDC090109]|uniref:DUF397 domain-containing protein n=1 Tax=Streptomyces TaxID=1883 RepID=UPI0038149B4B